MSRRDRSAPRTQPIPKRCGTGLTSNGPRASRPWRSRIIRTGVKGRCSSGPTGPASQLTPPTPSSDSGMSHWWRSPKSRGRQRPTRRCRPMTSGPTSKSGATASRCRDRPRWWKARKLGPMCAMRCGLVSRWNRKPVPTRTGLALSGRVIRTMPQHRWRKISISERTGPSPSQCPSGVPRAWPAYGRRRTPGPRSLPP